MWANPGPCHKGSKNQGTQAAPLSVNDFLTPLLSAIVFLGQYLQRCRFIYAIDRLYVGNTVSPHMRIFEFSLSLKPVHSYYSQCDV